MTYHEPSFELLATFTSWLYFLQVFRNVADYLLGAGLLGEIGVGIVYGPVAQTGFMPVEWQETIIVIGYLGLVLIVFEGGLTISPDTFLPTLPLALGAAMIGILLPIAFTL